MSELRIGDRIVGETHPTLIIAEIGVNHDGSLDRALELVQIATRAGADAVKLQFFRAERLMNGSAEFAAYQKSRANAADPIAMLKQYELSDDNAGRIIDAIRKTGLIPLATPFSPEDVDLIEKLQLPVVKIAAPDLVNKVLLQRAMQLHKPLLLSAGAATMEEIERTVGWLTGNDSATGCGCHSHESDTDHRPVQDEKNARVGDPCHGFALLHCISSYPTPDDQAHLKWIGELKAKTSCVIGYSDHTTSTIAGAFAVCAGARIVEKHLTYDQKAGGPDHSASLDETGMTEYARNIRQAEAMLGTGSKRVLDIEQDVRRVSRQSLVARGTIAKGKVITRSDLTVQRPARGIPASDVDAVVGTVAREEILSGTMIQWKMIEQK